MSNVEAFSDFLPDQRCLMSCLRIKFRQGVGTAFFIRYGQKHFLVTADHVVSGLHDGDNFAFQFNDTWIMSRCNRVIRCNIGTDVAMIIGEDRFHKFFSGQGFDYSQLIQGVLLGGIVAYLGFPLGLNVRVGIKKDGTFANLERDP
ncbi:MAG TPA: hypothetical protein VMY41_19220 [Thermohalobaculum sp.]|nr:hypothetical protein [Thermohalobaculum sp.]